LGNAAPIVSFTFDDFPRSACTVGGSILKSHHVRATYYVAMGLMDTTNELGQYFHAQDLHDLIADGHELAGHTFSHVSCRSTSLRSYRCDVLEGQLAVNQLTKADTSGNFAYPFGHVTLAAKKAIGRLVLSSRGTRHGINGPLADLNLLRANKLYSNSIDFSGVEGLVAENQKLKGWLIFYTHDVSDNPSSFGCSPQYLEAAVRCVIQAGARVLTIAEALASITREHSAPEAATP
jgi:peptidoglycan/xylan/chitin deacetylase (PgdA/CDA1 family)